MVAVTDTLAAMLYAIATNTGALAASGATETSLAAILAKLIAAPATEAKQGIPKTPGKFYSILATAYAAYATPTDMLTLTCPAGKRLIIMGGLCAINTTAAGLQDVYWIKRAVNTGGISTTPTPAKLDSVNAASTAVVNLYSAAPTLGAAIDTFCLAHGLTGAVTAGPGFFNFMSAGNLNAVQAALGVPAMGFVLNAGETLAINFNGAALPAGFAAQMGFCWIEEAA